VFATIVTVLKQNNGLNFHEINFFQIAPNVEIPKQNKIYFFKLLSQDAGAEQRLKIVLPVEKM